MNLFVFLFFLILTLFSLKIFIVPHFEGIDSSNKSSFLNRVFLSIFQSTYFFLRIAALTYSLIIVILIICIILPSLLNIKNLELFIGSAVFFENIADIWKWYFSVTAFSLSFLILGLILFFYRNSNKNNGSYYNNPQILSRIIFGLSIAERISGVREILAISSTVFF